MRMEKIEFRKTALQRLKKVSKRSHYNKDKKVLAMLSKQIAENKSVNIMLYLPLALEVNLYPLIKKLRKEKRIFMCLLWKVQVLGW